LHTDAVEETITGARDGVSGRWAKQILQISNLKVVRTATPSPLRDGEYQLTLEQKTELVAATSVRDIGGIYLGFDVHALQDIQTYRFSGFPSVTSELADGHVSHDFFMSRKGAMLPTAWVDELERTYAAGGGSLSKASLPQLVHRIRRKASNELLTLDADALVSDKRSYTTSLDLFRVRDEEIISPPAGRYRPSNPPRILKMTRENDFKDWSNTYLLQVANAHEHKWMGEEYEYITPRHILQRRSNFARALYPITKVLYDKGLINLEDNPTA
jgi:hypothetical protein